MTTWQRALTKGLVGFLVGTIGTIVLLIIIGVTIKPPTADEALIAFLSGSGVGFLGPFLQTFLDEWFGVG